MSFLRGSQNYVWSTTSVLGKGATGAVYQGVNKSNGEPVAVKTFNQMSQLRPTEVQLREFQVLEQVNHENIVKLLAIEEEHDNNKENARGKKVIVMELCTGGSLFNTLDDPENTYGLEESEFLLVLEHLTAGMKHLRDNNLVHRDLKPGNIMKFIRDDGTTVYKLTDFGAARELQEGQEFQSLYGTEEYLHPDMYERAVLKKDVNKTFGATIDLWSIGVTLYHVATGNLPFRPYGGRKNKETMYYITTKKASGVISGIQLQENGPIEWRKELPNNCQLSAGLKKIITPLLAGLLEADSRKIWSFDKFFKEVTDALSRNPINIFHVNKAHLIKVYIHPDDTYQQLQSYLHEQTNISSESQIILYKDATFLELIEENMRADGYPTTTEDDPLFLFSKENNNITVLPETELPKFKDFPTMVSVENDAPQAKVACSIGHLFKKRIEKSSMSCKLIKDGARNFSNYINNGVKQSHQDAQYLLDKTNVLKKTSQILELSQEIASSKFSEISVENYTENLKLLGNKFRSETSEINQQLYTKYSVQNALNQEWESSSKGLNCPFTSRAAARARTLVEQLRDSWQHLVRNRATRHLTYNDEQFHVLERIKISKTFSRIKDLLEKEVSPQYVHLAEALGDWYKTGQTLYLKMEILCNDVKLYENSLRKFEDKLTIENLQYTENVKTLLEQAKSDTCNTKLKKAENELLKNVFNRCNISKKETEEIMLQNSEILNKINVMLLNITP